MSPTTLDQKQTARWLVLHALYDLTQGARSDMREPYEIAERTGLSVDAVNAAIEYLDDEGLLEIRAACGSGHAVTIAHAGVREVEDALQKPERGTEHFPAVIINNQLFNGPVAAVQTGDHASIESIRQVSAAQPCEPLDFDPLAALDDVIRWVQTTLRSRVERERQATLLLETDVVVRRLEAARAALEAVKSAVDGDASKSRKPRVNACLTSQ